MCNISNLSLLKYWDDTLHKHFTELITGQSKDKECEDSGNARHTENELD